MKSSVIIFCLWGGLLFGPGLLRGQTILHGTFPNDTTLTAAGNPYQVTADLFIPDSVSLTLGAGVWMIFDSAVTVYLDGTLRVLGTATDSVYLVGKNGPLQASGPNIGGWPKGIWGGIVSDSLFGKVEANYMVAAHASFFLDPPEILILKNSSFFHHHRAVLALPGVYALIESCKFNNCASAVVGTGIEMNNSLIENCTMGASVFSSTLHNCTIQNCSITGLEISNALGGSTVSNSHFYDNWNGLRIVNFGLQMGGLPDTTFLIGNTIMDNQNGLRLDYNAGSNFEIIVTNNVICNQTFNVQFFDTLPSHFENNCWCSVDSLTILQTITWYNSYPQRIPAVNPSIFIPFQTDCISGEVYPGDANHDQVANFLDILTIGQYFGQTGPPRPNASLSWHGQPAPNWSTDQATGHNLKHADCNGDSTIDWADTLAIRLNYGRMHRARRTASVNGIPLILQAPAAAQNPGDTVHLPILLGTVDTVAYNVYGIAFSIHYDASQVVPVPSVHFPHSWLGIPGTNMIGFGYVDTLASRIDVALVGTNGLARSGFGQIAELVVVIDDDITKRNIPLRLSFSDVYAIDSAGNQIPVRDEVEPTVVEVDEGGDIGLLFRAYPNPASDFVIIEPKISVSYGVRMVDMMGRVWLRQNNLMGRQRLCLAHKPGGLYILQFRTGGFVESFKLVHP